MDTAHIDETEKTLAAFPGIADTAVITHDAGPDDGTCLIAYIVPAGPGLDLPALHAHARTTLSQNAMPAAIMAIDQIPRTPAGTPDTTALPLPELSGLPPYHPPATPRQETLCELFAQVLGVARCGTTSDFFDLGGRSVEAMMLAGRISTALSIKVSMADLFRAPTVADMDTRLDQITATRK